MALQPAISVPERSQVAAILKEFTTLSRSTIRMSLDRASQYLPLVQRELALFDLPLELAALPLVESHYNPKAVSGSNAAGLWQFVASTARLYGMRVDFWVDERFDPVASTRAAARHLKDLLSKFGDWDLVLAAYNAGSGCIDRAKKPFPGGDFWELCSTGRIRPQTQRYVPKFYATLAIMNDPPAYGFESPAPSEIFVYDSVLVDAPLALPSLAKRMGLKVEELYTLNPALRKGCTPPGKAPFELRVPSGAGEVAELEVSRLLDEERLDLKRHKVAQGESLWKVAHRYNADAEAIVAVNRLANPKKLKPGSELAIPLVKKLQPRREVVASSTTDEEGKAGSDAKAHTVASGDTLWKISRLYGVSVEELKAINGLSGDALTLGQKLALGVQPASAPARDEGGRFHVVSKGDTLSSIARRNDVTPKRLRELNRLTGNALLHPGDRLKIAP